MDRPEWVAVTPARTWRRLRHVHEQHRAARRPTRTNPRSTNQFGHILRWQNTGGDTARRRSSWSSFALPAGPRLRRRLDDRSQRRVRSPDGLYFDPDGRLWIQTDGSQPVAVQQPDARRRPGRPATSDASSSGRRAARSPASTTTEDQRTMFVNIQRRSTLQVGALAVGAEDADQLDRAVDGAEPVRRASSRTRRPRPARSSGRRRRAAGAGGRRGRTASRGRRGPAARPAGVRAAGADLDAVGVDAGGRPAVRERPHRHARRTGAARPRTARVLARRRPEQLVGADAERGGERRDVVEGEAALAGLQPAQRRDVDVGRLGDLLQRQPRSVRSSRSRRRTRSSTPSSFACMASQVATSARRPSCSSHGSTSGTASSSAAAPPG